MPPIVFSGVRLIDGTGAPPRAAVDVVVRSGRVERIAERATNDAGGGPGLPDDAVVVRGDGATLLPGLIDAHAHYTFDPAEGSLQAIARRSDEEILAAAGHHAERALRAGITTARGAGSIRGLELVLRDRIASGRQAGPRLVAAGTAVGAPDGHGTAFGVGASGPAALAAATERVIDAGADVVKVVASEAAMLTTTGHAPGRVVLGRPELTEAEIAAVVAVAHRRGRRVMAHAQDGEAVRRCAGAGVDSIEHAWLADAGAIEAVAASGAFLVPTLAVTDVNRTLPGLDPAQRARQDLIEERHRASCRAAIERGVAVVTGTDTGEVGVTADLLHREIALLVAHGLTPLAAIHAATGAGASLLGVEADTGTVVPGKTADLVLVDGDPLAELASLARPRLVLQGGHVVAGSVEDPGRR